MTFTTHFPAPSSPEGLYDVDQAARLHAAFEPFRSFVRDDLTFVTPTAELRTLISCRCDRITSCPRCTIELNANQWDGSAHALLQAPALWASMGYVQGFGAPSLWWRDDEHAMDVRIWGRLISLGTNPYRHVRVHMMAHGATSFDAAITGLVGFLERHQQAILDHQALQQLTSYAHQHPDVQALIDDLGERRDHLLTLARLTEHARQPRVRP